MKSPFKYPFTTGLLFGLIGGMWTAHLLWLHIAMRPL